MDRQNFVVVYNSLDDAERAREELIRFGIPAEDIRLSAAGGGASAATSGHMAALPAERHGGFWDWLFGSDVPEHDRDWYTTNLGEGRTALSVLLRDYAQRERVTDILEKYYPVEFDDQPADAALIAQQGAAHSYAGPAETRTGAPELTKEGDQVIPVVKEELSVGKRAAERRYRIRTYVVETPVEEQVRLRDERVIIEHRPASGTIPGGADNLREREFEVVERHEEPVIEKHAHAVEEVVVHREATERVETVRDTVRETKVDVDQELVDRKAERDVPANRRP